jgi:UDP-N-acetylmuramoylalanine--D-glutamate ligase
MGSEIVILGAGESGVGAALLAQAKGLSVFVSDMGIIQPRFMQELKANGIEFEEGKHSEERILKASEVIKSPGIPDKAPLIKALHKKGISVISEIEFAGRYSKAFMIGITGSNGKTTTTLWIHHILTQAGFDAVLAGNVGTSLARTLVERDPAIVVLELSSFQLDGMAKFRCNVGILTNITPDHLDRYDYVFQNYINSKFRIIQNQTAADCFIYGKDDPVLMENFGKFDIGSVLLPFSIKENSPASVKDEKLVIQVGPKHLEMPVAEISLKGKHNLYNAMAAGLAALSAGASVEAIVKGLSSFGGVEHRLEPAGTVNEVVYINDSKATNVNSAWFALDSMTRPVVWIAGGIDKGNDYSELFDLVTEKVKVLICLGVDNSKLIRDFADKVDEIMEAKSMEEAIDLAHKSAIPGDVVLLSPACASFDLFNNYEHRGKLFKENVANL